MKTKFNLVSRLAYVAVTASALGLGSHAFAQATAEETGPPKGTSSMAGVGQKPRKSEQKASPSPAAGAATGALSGNDRQFVQMAAKGGMHEVQMGQMAQKDGKSDEVKKLGAMIVADHTKANNEVMALASANGIKLDTRQKMDKMSKSDMANFDQAWLAAMVNDHQKDIAAFEQEAQQGTDPKIRDFAKKTAPVLKKHLKAVQAAQKKMGSGQ